MTHDDRKMFGARFVTLGRRWRRRLDAELAREGLTDASWSPLFHLSEGGDNISQGELAERVGLDSSSLVRLIDLLAERGLLRRETDPQDRRSKRIRLTPEGEAKIALLRHRLQEIEAELLVDLSDAELAPVMAVFDTIAARLAVAARKD